MWFVPAKAQTQEMFAVKKKNETSSGARRTAGMSACSEYVIRVIKNDTGAVINVAFACLSVT